MHTTLINIAKRRGGPFKIRNIKKGSATTAVIQRFKCMLCAWITYLACRKSGHTARISKWIYLNKFFMEIQGGVRPLSIGFAETALATLIVFENVNEFILAKIRP